MASFLLREPQPGDGSWLLQNDTLTSNKKPRKKRRSKKKTFLTRRDSVVSGNSGVDVAPFVADAPAEEEVANGPLAQPNSLSNYFVPAATTTPTPANFHANLPLPLPSLPEAQSTLETMAIPPHLRRKLEAARQDASANTHSAPEKANIVEKLSQLGVSVSQPQPARPASDDEDAPVYRGRGGAAPPTNKEHRERSRRTRDQLKAAKKEAREGGWAHNKEISKGDPSRWEADWAGKYNEPQPAGWAGESNKSFSIDSARADGGYGGNGKKRTAEDEAQWNLADWGGNWAPAPCDWDCRPAFRTDQSEGQIWQWLDMTEHAQRFTKLEPGTKIEDGLRARRAGPALDELSTVDGITYVFGSPEDTHKPAAYEQMGDVVPRQWIPETWGRLPPQTFWLEEILKSTAPPPEDEGDLDGAQPWWELIVKGGNFLPNIEAPSIKGIDPRESAEERMLRESDFGSTQHAENRKRFEVAKIKGKRENKQRKDEKAKKVAAAKLANNGLSPEHLSKISVDRKLFIRHATEDDMREIRDLYNYYVDFTCAGFEIERLSTGEMTTRYHDVVLQKLPYLVACEKGGVQKARRKNQEDIILPDKIVGFAFANDLYGPQGNMFRYTVEVEFYTHKDALMRGVAKCLLDKLLALLDPEYLERGGYGVGDENLETGVGRPSRLVKNILINFYHESSRPQKLEWISRFLGQFADFERVGYLKDVGSKNVAISHAIFQRTTGAALDHANAPDVLIKHAGPSN